jgi:hypothetical protein
MHILMGALLLVLGSLTTARAANDGSWCYRDFGVLFGPAVPDRGRDFRWRVRAQQPAAGAQEGQAQGVLTYVRRARAPRV